MGFTEICGYYYNLKKGFDEIGIESHFFSLFPHPFSYNENEDKELSFMEKFIRKIIGKIIDLRKSSLFKNIVINLFLKIILGIALSSYYVFLFVKYNVFIIGFAYFPFRGLELPFFRFFGKKLICVFHGSDSRPPYINGAIIPNDIDFDIFSLAELTKNKKKLIDKINRYADIIIDAPATSLFHSRDVLSWFYIGIPYKKPNNIKINDGTTNKEHVRILHSPSNPIPKGTNHIEQVINKLKTKGHKIDFVKISGMPNSVVIDEISKCDFIVDEIFSDTTLATFATEAASFGKPAVVGGEFSIFIHKEVPNQYIPPSLFVGPEDVELAIEKMITNIEFRLELGQTAKKFVEKYWHPKAVAGRFINALDGNTPGNAKFSPYELTFTGGYGMSRSWRNNVIRLMIDAFGTSSLQLDDKPNLRDALIKPLTQLYS